MKILVTGSAGHLGEALMRTLRAKQVEAVGVDVLDSPFTDIRGSIADRAVVDAVMERTGTAALRTRALRDLSDGECQQVMVARALVQATPVVLLDEPTAHLDLPNRVRIVRLLRTRQRPSASGVFAIGLIAFGVCGAMAVGDLIRNWFLWFGLGLGATSLAPGAVAEAAANEDADADANADADTDTGELPDGAGALA